MKYRSIWCATLHSNHMTKHSDCTCSMEKKPTALNSDKIVPKYLLCGGGTLFCLILGLETSVSCSICGTWEAILSESLSDTITDGSVETASEGASSGYLKKIGKKFQEFTKSYNSKTFLYSYFGTILSRCWEDGTEKLSQKNLLKLYSKPQDCDCHLVPKLFSCIQAK